LLERAAALAQAGEPFVLATVVRSVKPASARPGDRALLTRDGASEGWVGGGCVQTSIEREARQALLDGAPRLVRLAPEVVPEDGIVSYPMTCHSGGTLEIYLEPVLPAPVLVALGDSPVSEALCALAPPLGFRVTRSLDASSVSDTWVVAAAMSSSEDHPIVRDALARGVPYVAMVSSRKRADVLRSELRSDGVDDTALKAPAGLDIGAATPAEIALSILAEIIQRRRATAVTPAIAEPPRDVAIDPICGMEVDIATARWTAEREGQTYYFCAPGCRKAFQAQAQAQAH